MIFPCVGRPFVRYLGLSHGKIVSCAIPSDATDSPTAITAQTADNLMNLFILLLFSVSLDAANIHLFPDMASAGCVFFCSPCPSAPRKGPPPIRNRKMRLPANSNIVVRDMAFLLYCLVLCEARFIICLYSRAIFPVPFSLKRQKTTTKYRRMVYEWQILQETPHLYLRLLTPSIH